MGNIIKCYFSSYFTAILSLSVISELLNIYSISFCRTEVSNNLLCIFNQEINVADFHLAF